MRLTSGYGPTRPEIDHVTGLSLDERRRQHGHGSYRLPEKLSAGTLIEAAFTLELGRLAVPAGGKLGIVWRWPFDWGELQTRAPAGPGFVRIDGPVPLAAEYDPYGGIEPYHHQLLLHVQREALAAGSLVRVEMSRWRTPTCALRDARFLMLVDPHGDNRWTELPGGTSFDVSAGDPARLVALAPSDVTLGEELTVIVRADDRWGNPTRLPALPVLTPTFGASAAEPVVIDWPAAYHCAVRFERAGTHRLRFEVPGTSLVAESNPIVVHTEPPARRLFWGDVHSGQSAIGCGAGTLADYYAFARDAAGVQFLTHQANDHYVTTADWLETRRVTDEFHAPGKYVPILGCEWSPPTADGGDRNVFYRHDEPRLIRSGRFFTETTPDPEPDVPRAPEFLACFRDQNVLINMHVGGRMTNLDWHEPQIEKLAEIHSTHGTVEWFVFDCLRRGYRVGVTAGTDGVMGRPGACAPGSRLCRNLRNGLTGIYATALTRDALWEALHARRTYGTTGERIRLWCEADGHAMGEKYETTAVPRVFAVVEGTAALERIDLFRGTEVIHTWPVATSDESTLRILWSGTTACGNARKQRAVWDGSLEIDAGAFGEVEPIGFCTPLDVVARESPRKFIWQSATAGNAAGLLLRFDGEPTTCRFRSGPNSFDFTPTVVRARELSIPAGGFDRQIRVGKAPRQDGPRRVEVSYFDHATVTGSCPYWVRVTQ
ncbi:MAG: DUF3604 domain-containing protein, partial [Gemmataceae bacterium]